MRVAEGLGHHLGRLAVRRREAAIERGEIVVLLVHIYAAGGRVGAYLNVYSRRIRRGRRSDDQVVQIEGARVGQTEVTDANLGRDAHVFLYHAGIRLCVAVQVQVGREAVVLQAK